MFLARPDRMPFAFRLPFGCGTQQYRYPEIMMQRRPSFWTAFGFLGVVMLSKIGDGNVRAFAREQHRDADRFMRVTGFTRIGMGGRAARLHPLGTGSRRLSPLNIANCHVIMSNIEQRAAMACPRLCRSAGYPQICR
jgi:hypothetical protein